MRVIVGITGATGAVYGIRTLEMLRALGVETELCISRWGARTIEHETALATCDVRALATHSPSIGDQSAAISSGSHAVDAMLVVPCSVRTLAAIAHGTGDNLICRSADVTLKERRPLVLVVRETPLNQIHLANMQRVARAGAVVMPPMPAFYGHPQSISDLIDQTVMRVLDQIGLRTDTAPRWNGALLRRASVNSGA